MDDQLIKELVARELAKNPTAVDPKPAFSLGLPSNPGGGTVSPEALHTMGGLADAAGTYFGLSKRLASESNPMLKQASPAQAGLGLLGQLAATKGITHLLRKTGHPGIADAIASQLGAQQLSLGSDWGSALSGHPVTQAGNDVYAQKLLMRQTNGR